MARLTRHWPLAHPLIALTTAGPQGPAQSGVVSPFGLVSKGRPPPPAHRESSVYQSQCTPTILADDGVPATLDVCTTHIPTYVQTIQHSQPTANNHDLLRASSDSLSRHQEDWRQTMEAAELNSETAITADAYAYYRGAYFNTPSGPTLLGFDRSHTMSRRESREDGTDGIPGADGASFHSQNQSAAAGS
ncbi:uncharacterized protein C8Q71DRAFT_875416 [Rhodofomes roseus]|uniref:Uncharacterized protein n=1 Tax=Rhodofomes roseus TaxID=34475 RepID=A0ABQ8K8F6_9APHY|nr:uncharacterized protein C8Q71DRAFT_875416 [Rhodofomes roseus]KAH9833559.1 hypothetical protein C8Q71DRAFT_875416 [Rhodofomes roseus]